MKVKLVNDKGETVVREDGSPMTFIMVDEAELRELLKKQEFKMSDQLDYQEGWNDAILEILGEA